MIGIYLPNKDMKQRIDVAYYPLITAATPPL